MKCPESGQGEEAITDEAFKSVCLQLIYTQVCRGTGCTCEEEEKGVLFALNNRHTPDMPKKKKTPPRWAKKEMKLAEKKNKQTEKAGGGNDSSPWRI